MKSSGEVRFEVVLFRFLGLVLYTLKNRVSSQTPAASMLYVCMSIVCCFYVRRELFVLFFYSLIGGSLIATGFFSPLCLHIWTKGVAQQSSASTIKSRLKAIPRAHNYKHFMPKAKPLLCPHANLYFRNYPVREDNISFELKLLNLEHILTSSNTNGAYAVTTPLPMGDAM